ncbi:MAG: alpha/beta hydrolase, partial [Colwellia sp.]
MSEIETVLSDSGYTVVNHDYPSTKATIQVLAAKELPKAIGNCPTDVTINFVTHSLGGIILRQFLSTDTLINIGRVVMLGPPNKGSEVVDNLGDWKVFEFVNGPAGTQLGTEKSSVPNTIGPAHFEVGIIAGTSTVNPILSTMLPNPDDGKVSVENTKLEGMKDHITMAVTHT